MLEDLDLSWASSWVVASALEADSLEVKLVVEVNLNPGSFVVADFPLIPVLLALAEEVLGLALVTSTEDVVLSGDDSLVVKVIAV